MKKIIYIFTLLLFAISYQEDNHKNSHYENIDRQTLNMQSELTNLDLTTSMLNSYFQKILKNFSGNIDELINVLSNSLKSNFGDNLIFMFVKTNEKKLVIKIIYNQKRYTIIIGKNEILQNYFIEQINGPFLTAKDWLAQYGFNFNDIPQEDSSGNLENLLNDLRIDNVAKLEDMKDKIFCLSISNLTALDIPITNKLKILLNSGANIHILYPVESNLLPEQLTYTFGEGRVILHPIPRLFYFENMKLVFDTLINIEAILNLETKYTEQEYSEFYCKIRGIPYQSVDDYIKKNKGHSLNPLTRRSRVYEHFSNFFANLDKKNFEKQMNTLHIRESLNNINITILTSEMWFIGGAETYLSLEIAYLLAQYNMTINIVFPDTTLAGEYLPPLDFGKGRIKFFPLNIEKIKLKYNNEVAVEIEMQKILQKLIPKTDIFLCHQLYMQEFPIFLKCIKNTKIPFFGMYHGGKQLLTGKLNSLNNDTILNLQQTVSKQELIIGTVSDTAQFMAGYIGRQAQKHSKNFYCGPLVDFHLFSKENINPDKIKTLKEKYKITEDCPVLILPHRIHPDKGILETIKATHQAFTEMKKDFRMFIIGDNSNFITYQENIDEYIKSNNLNDKIILLANMDQLELLHFYALSNLGILLTVAEGKPLTPIESRAVDLPWLMTNIDGIIDDRVPSRNISPSVNGSYDNLSSPKLPKITGSIFSISILNEKKRYLESENIIENCKLKLLKIFHNKNWKELLKKAGENGELLVKKYYSPATVMSNHEDLIEALLLEKKLLKIITENQEVQRVLMEVLKKNNISIENIKIKIEFFNKGTHKYVYLITIIDQAGKEFKIALKLLKESNDPPEIKSFIKEYQRTKIMDHASYVQKIYNLFDVQQGHEKFVFTLCQFIEGENLGDILADNLELKQYDEVTKILKKYLYTLGKIFGQNMILRFNDSLIYSECLVDPDYSNFIVTANGNVVLSDFGETTEMSLFDFIYIIQKRIELRNRLNSMYQGSLKFFDENVWESFFDGFSNSNYFYYEQIYAKTFSDIYSRLPNSLSSIVLKNVLSKNKKMREYLFKNSFLKNKQQKYHSHKKQNPKIKFLTNFTYTAPPRLYYSILSRVEIFGMTVKFVHSEFSNAFIYNKTLYLPMQTIKILNWQLAILSAQEFNLFLDKYISQIIHTKTKEIEKIIDSEINFQKIEQIKKSA
jgi:hypothetical protein